MVIREHVGADFARSMSVMLGAGLPLVVALETARSRTRKDVQRCLDRLIAEVADGVALSEAMGRERMFDRTSIAMVRSAETTGKLASAWSDIADEQERATAVRARIRMALAYPAIVLTVAIATSLFFLYQVIPGFAEIYETLETSLPRSTQVLLLVSRRLRQDIFGITLAACAAAAFLYLGSWSPSVRSVSSKIADRLPFVGSLRRVRATAAFCGALAALLRANVRLDVALDEVRTAWFPQGAMHDSIRRLAESIREGEPFSRALAEQLWVPPLVVRIASAGDASARLGDVMLGLAAWYRAEFERRVETAMTLAEPLLILVLGAIVGGMLIVLYMPMFRLGGI